MRFLRRGRSERESRDVERGMERVAADDNAGTRSELYAALLDTTLVVMTPTRPAEVGTWTAQEGDQIALVILGGEDGPVLPVFTSVERLLEWQPEGGGNAALPSRALFEMALGSEAEWLAVNPGSTTTGALGRGELEALARGRLPIVEGDVVEGEVVAAGTKVRIGRAAQLPPAEVVNAVRRAVEAEERAAGAWLYLMQQGSNEPEHVVGVALADGVTEDDGQAALRRIAEEAGVQSPGVRELLFVAVDDEFRRSLESGGGDFVFAR